jgi:hypothetical protein
VLHKIVINCNNLLQFVIFCYSRRFYTFFIVMVISIIHNNYAHIFYPCVANIICLFYDTIYFIYTGLVIIILNHFKFCIIILHIYPFFVNSSISLFIVRTTEPQLNHFFWLSYWYIYILF